MSTPKIIIAGGRDFNDYEFLRDQIDALELPEFEVVSGACRGTDKLGERYAEERDLPDPKLFPADWDKFGRGAGPIRNEEMARYADALIAFWDGDSRGTKLMIDIAERYGLEIKIINYDKDSQNGT